MVLKKIKEKLKSTPIKLVFYLILSSIIFSIIYHFIDNQEFATWVTPSVVHYNLGHQFISYIFDKYANKNSILTKERFLKIPIYKGTDDKLHLILQDDEITKAPRSIKLKEQLFNLYNNNDNIITSDIFFKIPFNINRIPTKKILDIIPHKYYAKYVEKSVHNYIDKLYFSIVTQTLLGYGDIIPASNKVRFLVCIQILISLYFMT